MICYKDMTFCDYYADCLAGSSCIRSLTEETKQKAQKMELPICHFIEKPDCFMVDVVQVVER